MFTSRTARSKALGAACAAMIIAISASYVFADEATSSSFQFNDSGFTQLGGYSTTSNFSSFGSMDAVNDGESTSTSFSMSGGYLYQSDVSPFLSQNWRWYDDAIHDTPVSPLAAENVAPGTVAYNDPLKLRITVRDAAGSGVSNVKLRLQYSTSSDFSTGADYVAEQGQCDPTVWCYADGGGTDNTSIQEATLSDAQSCSGGLGNGCGSYNESGTSTSGFFHFATTRREYDFTIKQTVGIAGMVYFFRLVDNTTGTPVPLNTGKSYPSVTVDGGTLSFLISGLTSGASTEGVTTDISTQPTSVPFGSLPIGSARIAAHRLTVTTNAGNGYKVYAFQRQGLLSAASREIAPVSAANSSPLAWSSACTASSTGCYGYHSGEDVLEGGSTRFAADDSFAPFTSNADEVAYGSGPANAVSTDIVYKIEVKGKQDAGDYQSSIVYIATPVF